MKLHSIRLKLTLWNVAILAVVLVLFLTAVHVAVRVYMLSAIDRRLERLATYQATPRTLAVQRGMIFSQTPGSRRPLRLLRVYNLSGRLLAPNGQPARNGEPPWDPRAFRQAAAGHRLFSTARPEGDDAPYRVFSCPFKHGSRQVGVVQAAFPLTEVVVLQNGLTLIILLLVPFALLAAGVGGLLVTNRALRPVRQIAATAEEINASDLSQRLPVAGDDEFAQLAVTINRMLGRLAGAFGQLERSIEQERRFTSDASHELRTPLTAIKANTSLALRGERTPEQYRDALRAADKAADLMTNLVNDLLLLARSDSGQLVLHPQAVDPATLFADAIALLERGEDHAAITIEIADPATRLWGDPQHLLRLITNLLQNALRYTPASGNITLAAAQHAETVTLTVRDTGEGIDPAHLAHLGERFYRIDPARARGGCGLGLSICKSIVAAHGGTLDITSTPGEGTTVTVTLPATH
ncbi:MAG TPA: ATP-binding protein [Armatimonadota bacterium]|jgi:heavy metal sensor kinase